MNAFQASLSPSEGFDPDPAQRDMARHLYALAAALPLLCPHGHVPPAALADPDYSFGTPTDVFIIPDHYVFRMLYSQGIPMERLGIPRRDGGAVETDHRKIWQTFAESFHLFRATPTGLWLKRELRDVFDIKDKLTADSAQSIYNQIAARLATPEFRPRALFERFKIEVLCTTDAATDSLDHHRSLQASGWKGRILPCFRPDGVVNLDAPGWRSHIESLSAVSGIEVVSYPDLIDALENRRAFFKEMGATATDHAVVTPYTARLSDLEADAIFQRALRGDASADDAARFTGHMLMEMARMSVEDGLVMQLHVGSSRNHNTMIHERFGPDVGADIPVATEFTRNLQALCNTYGRDPRLGLILFTLDESAYSRELAPLAGHYPAVKLGPPWWFLDSVNGMSRYLDSVIETAGLYNTVGFNDDTRAFFSIPARHDLWRRASANWLAGLVLRRIVDVDEAEDMMREMAYGLAQKAYRLA